MSRTVLWARGLGFAVAAGPLLCDVDLNVRAGEHWAVLGPNGAGKSTLLRLISGALRQTAGLLELCGEPHGAHGLLDPRLRLSMLEGSPRTYASELTGLDVVLLRQPGPAATLGAAVDPADAPRGRELLTLLRAEHLADRRYASCSQGERQRILLARSLMRDPALLLLDEPVAALDLLGREVLLRAMAELAHERPTLATVTVTHHLEELAPSTTHALLLADGATVAAGPVDDVLTDDRLSACFSAPIALARHGDRWTARVA